MEMGGSAVTEDGGEAVEKPGAERGFQTKSIERD